MEDVTTITCNHNPHNPRHELLTAVHPATGAGGRDAMTGVHVSRACR